MMHEHQALAAMSPSRRSSRKLAGARGRQWTIAFVGVLQSASVCDDGEE